MTGDSAFKKQVRARMAETGGELHHRSPDGLDRRGPGRPRVALRVYLNPHVDLELTDETARTFAAADELAQREMANRLLADHIELAGVEEAEVAAGSELVPVQNLRIDEIADTVHRRIPRTAGIATIGVSGDLDQVRVDIQTAWPGVAFGHGGAELDRLRAELEELTGKAVQLNVTGPDRFDGHSPAQAIWLKRAGWAGR